MSKWETFKYLAPTEIVETAKAVPWLIWAGVLLLGIPTVIVFLADGLLSRF